MKTNRELPDGERRVDNYSEYIFELRTEQNRSFICDLGSVGCDGEANRIKAPGYRHVGPQGQASVPDEAEGVSFP